jgi:hypothetical protein
MLNSVTHFRKTAIAVQEPQGPVHAQPPTILDRLSIAMSIQPAQLTEEIARAEARKLREAFGPEAANAALSAQHALLKAGKEDAAVNALSILTAIWDLEDAAA